MWRKLCVLWTINRPIDRIPYLLTGVVLFIVKYAIDWTIARQVFGISWSPINYLIWPNDRVLRVIDLDDPQRWFSLTMLLVSLPFIGIGITLTLRRLRATGLPLGLILFFFVPVVNLLFFLILILLPTRVALPAVSGVESITGLRDSTEPMLESDRKDSRIFAIESVPNVTRARGTAITGNAPRPPRYRFEPLREFHRSIVLESYWRSGLVALAITVPLAVFAVILGAEVLQSYGFSLFVGAPFAVGMISVLVFGYSHPKPCGPCLLVALAGTLLAGCAMLVFGVEGVICLIMAFPITLPLALLGGIVGYAIQSRPWLNDQATMLTLALLAVLPALMAAESAHEPEPDVREVRTEIIIAAPPAHVWEHVVSFPPLDEPDELLFRMGIAYPQRAEILGKGIGAVRHCVFSTGIFVEPIEVWDEPSLLRFRVAEQPEPMEEWSPYPIHPAHLDHYLQSIKGQFVLEPLPGGRTRLLGTTWYTNRMWPAAYWSLWSDYIIHRIHLRVLTHIQKTAEAK